MKFDLAVTVREKSGKGAARQLRRSGKVPGVLYGQGECLLLTIEPEPLIKILKSQAGSTALITLTINGAKAKAKRTAIADEGGEVRGELPYDACTIHDRRGCGHEHVVKDVIDRVS